MFYSSGTGVGSVCNSSCTKREENQTSQSIKKRFGKKRKNEEGRKTFAQNLEENQKEEK